MKLLEIQSKDFLFVRKELQRLVDSLVDNETSNEEERLQSKEELEHWLDNMWSNFPGNVALTDNPNFNFNEPIQVREPLDTSLQVEMIETKQKLRELTETLCKTRLELTKTVHTVTSDILKEQSGEAHNLTIVDTSPPKNETAKVDRDNTKQVETVYNDAVKILSDLEKTLPKQISNFENILDIAK